MKERNTLSSSKTREDGKELGRDADLPFLPAKLSGRHRFLPA
jgi:hypothetical protein